MSKSYKAATNLLKSVIEEPPFVKKGPIMNGRYLFNKMAYCCRKELEIKAEIVPRSFI